MEEYCQWEKKWSSDLLIVRRTVIFIITAMLIEIPVMHTTVRYMRKTIWSTVSPGFGSRSTVSSFSVIPCIVGTIGANSFASTNCVIATSYDLRKIHTIKILSMQDTGQNLGQDVGQSKEYSVIYSDVNSRYKMNRLPVWQGRQINSTENEFFLVNLPPVQSWHVLVEYITKKT